MTLTVQSTADVAPSAQDMVEAGDLATFIGWEVSIASARAAGTAAVTEQARQWPGRLRRIARAHLNLWLLPTLADDVTLLLSELVTNALLHGRSESVDVRISRTGRRLLVEVTGDAFRPPRPEPAEPLAESGRGLFLVEAVADEWGVSESGARTWCALTIDGGVR